MNEYMIVRILWGVLTLTRFPTSLAVGIAVVLPGKFTGHSWSEAVISAIPYTLAAGGGFALNDYYDVERDSIDKPYRAIPMRLITHSQAGRVGSCLVIAALVSGGLVSKQITQFVFYAAAVIGVIAYNFVVARYGFFKVFVIAGLCSLPLLAGIAWFKYGKGFFLLPVAAFFFIAAREILMDIKDAHGDGITGITTIPLLLGQKKATALSMCLVALSLTSLAILVVLTNNNRNLSFFASLSASMCVLLLLWHKTAISRRLIINLMWIPMLLAFAFLMP